MNITKWGKWKKFQTGKIYGIGIGKTLKGQKYGSITIQKDNSDNEVIRMEFTEDEVKLIIKKLSEL